MALLIRLTRICNAICFSMVISGTFSNSRITTRSWRPRAREFIINASSTSSATETLSLTPDTFAKLCCNLYDTLDVIDVSFCRFGQLFEHGCVLEA